MNGNITITYSVEVVQEGENVSVNISSDVDEMPLPKLR
jgi:hypothetical protein